MHAKPHTRSGEPAGDQAPTSPAAFGVRGSANQAGTPRQHARQGADVKPSQTWNTRPAGRRPEGQLVVRLTISGSQTASAAKVLVNQLSVVGAGPMIVLNRWSGDLLYNSWCCTADRKRQEALPDGLVGKGL
jgi:hypothetical protein